MRAKIKATGPLTVADYMKEVLINPASGYYTQQESIGAHGDFVTSPEVSQLFGEMIAVWILNEWHKVGSPKPMHLVELGPGKGTLMEDILRVFEHLKQLEGLSIHLVELSRRLQDEQARRLCSEVTAGKGGDQQFAWGTAHAGSCPVYWHHALSEVPRDAFTCKSSEGWREVLIDMDTTKEDSDTFRYIISRSETPACKVYSSEFADQREHVEVCLDGGAIMQELALRFEEDGGFLLMADYGHDGTGTDTFRGFKKHCLHDPLVDPGSADLTADVDFKFLRDSVATNALTFGPVTQKDFLKQLGIECRLEVLLQNPNLTPEAKENLKASVNKLIHPSEMGERFKFFAVFPKVLKEHLKRFPVSGFNLQPK
ncbi:hypothetical protein B566_EDAN002724 [Ephemera danica]|nr:hypothetical protein B566_EDAN002724 [Ephemera danica]